MTRARGVVLCRVLLRIAGMLLLVSQAAQAQFTPAFFQNNSYWGDGKAEFNFYDAQIVRYGEKRACEVLHIAVREPMDTKQMVKPDDSRRPDVIQVIKLNQILHVPTGIYVYQQMHSSFWRVEDAALAKSSLTSNDSCGNTFKQAKRFGGQISYEFHTYWDGMANGTENLVLPENGYFYDELPMRVRTMDFAKAKPAGEFEIQLTGTTINSKKDKIEFKPAKLRYTSTDRTIDVTVDHASGKDEFTLDRNFPYLLRRWLAADGSELKLKRSLKIDYWNFNKPGDRERALADRRFNHPD